MSISFGNRGAAARGPVDGKVSRRPDSHGSARRDPGRPLPRAPHPGAPVSAPRSSLSSCEDPLLPPGERELRLPPRKPARKPSPLDASLSGFPRPLASAGCPGC